MEKILVKETFSILIDKHPHYENLNKKILEELSSVNFWRNLRNPDGGLSNVRSEQSFGDTRSKSIDLIRDWVTIMVDNISFGSTHHSIASTWVARYRKDDHAVTHHHIPYPFSFVYFIKTPKGSSPFVFTKSGKRIKAEEGKVVIFPGNMYHHVPKNNCDDRVTLAGNLVQSTNYK